MPGHNCSVFGCHTNSEKCPTLSFHGLPKKGVSDNSDKWREDLIKAICRSDKSFNPGNAKICSRHFASDCIVTKSGGRKVLVPGSHLTRFLPETSHPKPSETPRKPPTVREPPTVVADLAEAEVPQCPGILNAELQPYASLPDASNNAQYYLHVSYMRVEERMTCTTTIRAHGCDWTMETLGKIACDCCLACRPLVVKKFQRDKAAATKDVQKLTPLTKMSKSRVTSALKAERVEKKAALEQLNKIRSQLNEESVRLPNETHEKLSDIVENADKDSFISKFWSEQKKAFSIKANGMRWHPMMVRFAILVHSQSPSTYRTLREIGAIKLPSESTLKDYTNVVHPTSGFSMPVFQELKNMAEPLSDNERWVVLLHDEISIKADLIYDKRTGDLVGFVEQGQWKEESDNLATHALVFMAVGLTSNIKMSLGYFPTTTATADRIFPLFWQAVGLLETVCNLKVIASTSDKASPNQRLVKMHGESGYKALNLYAPERHIYFFSDAPHLIKTLRNNLSSSGFGKNSKFLWNDGSDLLWSHVKRLYDEDSCREIRRTKLTAEHIHLTPQSVMRVYLAAQVLSHSVGSIMQTFGQPDCQETARFILLMDKFFDCLNVSSAAEGTKRNNIYLKPYCSVDDDRFRFLAEDVMGYIESWKQSVFSREGFQRSERNKMFLSQQTYDGIKTTVNSVIEATKYLLNSGVSMVLTNRFCQDPLESHFGRHRSLGVRAENPTLWTYGYQENKLRIQRSLALSILPKGNVRGKRNPNQVAVDCTPLPKIRRRNNLEQTKPPM